MNRWIITTAALSAMSLPVLGQAAAQPPTKPDEPKREQLDAAKRDADKREELNRAILDAVNAGAAPKQLQVVVEEVPPGGRGEALLRTYRLDAAPAAGGAAGGSGGVMGLAARPTKKEKVTYLGVITSGAAPSVREQLKLGKGVGLVVNSVEAKTAAETAGIKQNDVLEKLNDQILINTEQFTAVLRSMKVGDEVTLSVVRQGERQSIKAKLGEKEVETGGGDLAIFNQAVMPPPPAAANDFIFVQDGGGAVRVGNNNNAWTRALVGGVGGGEPINVIATVVDGKQTTTWSDEKLRIMVERENDKVSKITAFDNNTGKILFTGMPPAADDPALKALPELKDKINSAMNAAVTPTPIIVPPGGAGGNAPPTVFLGGIVPGGAGGGGGGIMGAGRGKVLKWQDGDHILVLRTMGNQPLYLLALSKKDGRTLYDGPVMTEEQRKSVPAEVSEQFELLSAHPENAKEFGAKEPKEPAVKDAAPAANTPKAPPGFDLPPAIPQK